MEAVHRHKTAITRQGLSTPMQVLARYGLFEEGRSVFDYGCGQGDDLAALRVAGITADGWDPHYFPDAEHKEANLVNLGFVLNVIEDPVERAEAARKAFDLARQCLVVAVMIVGKSQMDELRRYRDGYLTRRGTFQKYFTQSEIKEFLEDVLGEEAIAIAPGIFFIFRDKILEQRFLSERHRRLRDISHLLTIPARPVGEGSVRDTVLLEAHRELIDTFWTRMVELGRLPDPDELDAPLSENIAARLKSFRTAARLAQQVHDASLLREARETRIDDLKVYFALNLFNKRKPYQELPAELQRDVKAFFGSHRNALDAGRSLLFSLGSTDVIQEACVAAANDGLGHLDGAHSLQLHVDLIDRLPAALRTYVGCAEKLYGDVSSADLVKIHIHSGKLTLLKYDDFDGSPLPRLVERIKIKMRDQDIEFFDYGPDLPVQLLYMKSRYMAPDQPGYNKQKKFDVKLDSLGLFDFSRFGPPADEFIRQLKVAGIRVKGFTLNGVRNKTTRMQRPQVSRTL